MRWMRGEGEGWCSCGREARLVCVGGAGGWSADGGCPMRSVRGSPPSGAPRGLRVDRGGRGGVGCRGCPSRGGAPSAGPRQALSGGGACGRRWAVSSAAAALPPQWRASGAGAGQHCEACALTRGRFCRARPPPSASTGPPVTHRTTALLAVAAPARRAQSGGFAQRTPSIATPSTAVPLRRAQHSDEVEAPEATSSRGSHRRSPHPRAAAVASLETLCGPELTSAVPGCAEGCAAERGGQEAALFHAPCTAAGTRSTGAGALRSRCHWLDSTRRTASLDWQSLTAHRRRSKAAKHCAVATTSFQDADGPRCPAAPRTGEHRT